MVLVKMECRNCGAGMSILPGTNHAFCAYCGAGYLVQGNAEAQPPQAPAGGASRDNPVRVKLVPEDVRLSATAAILTKAFGELALQNAPRWGVRYLETRSFGEGEAAYKKDYELVLHCEARAVGEYQDW